jgi:hypothetical protein
VVELDAGGSRDPASVRNAAHAILSQPQFRQPPEAITDRFRHWIGNQLARIINDALSGHLGVIGALALIAILALTTWAVVRASRRIAFDAAVGGVALGGPRRPAADWLREAAACEAVGDWRNALLARYRALIAELSRRGVVDEVAGRTSGEYRREVERALPGVATEFGGATQLFEESRYGDRHPGPDDAASLQRISDRVLAATR